MGRLSPLQCPQPPRLLKAGRLSRLWTFSAIFVHNPVTACRSMDVFGHFCTQSCYSTTINPSAKLAYSVTEFPADRDSSYPRAAYFRAKPVSWAHLWGRCDGQKPTFPTNQSLTCLQRGRYSPLCHTFPINCGWNPQNKRETWTARRKLSPWPGTTPTTMVGVSPAGRVTMVRQLAHNPQIFCHLPKKIYLCSPNPEVWPSGRWRQS